MSPTNNANLKDSTKRSHKNPSNFPLFVKGSAALAFWTVGRLPRCKGESGEVFFGNDPFVTAFGALVVVYVSFVSRHLDTILS